MVVEVVENMGCGLVIGKYGEGGLRSGLRVWE